MGGICTRRRGDNGTPDNRITVMDTIYTLCGIIAVSGILMGTIFGVLWLLGVSL